MTPKQYAKTPKEETKTPRQEAKTTKQDPKTPKDVRTPGKTPKRTLKGGVQAEDLKEGTGPRCKPGYMVGIGVESLGDEVSSAHFSYHAKDTMENNIMNTAAAGLAVITGPRNSPSGLSVLVTAANTGQEVQFSSSDSFPLTAGTASLPDLILRDPGDIQFEIVQVRLDVHAS